MGPSKRKRYFQHPKLPTWFDVAPDDIVATNAARHACLTDGARGHRVLIHQDPAHASNFECDGSRKSKTGIPLTQAFASDGAMTAALRGVQGQPYYFTTFCTYAVAKPDGGKLWCSRTEDNIQDLTASMIDIDWHSHPYAKDQFADAEAVWQHVQELAERLGWPPINRCQFTGRGLLLGYQYRPVPAYWRDPLTKALSKTRQGALTRWRMMHVYMFNCVRHLTDDRSTLQPGHFSKVPGSPNMKNGKLVRVGREPGGDLYTFNLLFNQMAPKIKAAYMAGELDGYSVDWPQSWRKARIQRQMADQPLDTNVVSLATARTLKRAGGTSSKLKTDGSRKKLKTPELVGELIWSTRVVALVGYYKALLEEGRASGELRQRLLFLIAVALSWAEPTLWRQEFLRLITPLVDFREKEAMNRVCTVIRRAEEFLRGETRTFGEAQVDPRYRFSNETIRSAAWLNLTDDDIRSYPMLSPFATAELQKELYQVRQNARRRENGRSDRKGKTTGQDRETWLAEARTDAPQVQALRARGMSIRGIAAETGIPKSNVERLLAVPAADIRQADAGKVADAAARRTAQETPQAETQTDASTRGQAQILHIMFAESAEEIADKLAQSVTTVRRWLAEPEVLRALQAA